MLRVLSKRFKVYVWFLLSVAKFNYNKIKDKRKWALTATAETISKTDDSRVSVDRSVQEVDISVHKQTSDSDD
jgi:hypothetical protein